jgi:hypothetical protein
LVVQPNRRRFDDTLIALHRVAKVNDAITSGYDKRLLIYKEMASVRRELAKDLRDSNTKRLLVSGIVLVRERIGNVPVWPNLNGQ